VCRGRGGVAAEPPGKYVVGLYVHRNSMTCWHCKKTKKTCILSVSTFVGCCRRIHTVALAGVLVVVVVVERGKG